MKDTEEHASQADLDELTQVQVQLLLQRTAAGRVTVDPDRFARSAGEVAAVKLDKRGLPLLQTVSRNVRLMAEAHAEAEMVRLEKVKSEAARDSPIKKYLPGIVPVNQSILDDAAESDGFLELALNLYEEAFTTVAVCCYIYPNQDDKPKGVERNQAICVGSFGSCV